MTATAIARYLIKSKDSSAKCQKAAGGKPQRKPGFIVRLFDYTQVKWKVYLHLLKICCRWMSIIWPLDVNNEIHIFSPLKHQNHTRLSRRICRQKKSGLLSCSPPAWQPPTMQHILILGSFFDNRQWQSWAEFHGSCLSSGCSVWCVFDVVQAHHHPRLWLLAHDTKLRRSWSLQGRKEGSTLPRQSTQKQKQQSVIIQSELIHCDTV